MAGKEAVMVVLDCGRSMFQAPASGSSAFDSQTVASSPEGPNCHQTRLDVALECITLLFQQKLLFYSKTHETGMYLFGGDFETENELYGMKLGRTTVDNIRYVETLRKELACPGGEGDCFAALYSAAEHLDKYIGKKKVTKKIFFLTCGAGASKYSVGSNREKLLTKIQMVGCRVNIIAIDMGDCEGEKNIELTKDQKNNFDLLLQMEKKLPARVFSSTAAMQIYKQFRGKSIYPVAKYKGPLIISNELQLSVKVFAKTAEQSFPSLHKYSKVTPYQREETANKVQVDRFSYLFDDETLTPVPKENMVKAFAYGKKLIPVPNEVLEDIKYKSAKCLQLICFVPAANVPRHYFMSGVEMVIPDEEIRHNVDGMAAIIQGMYELETVGLFRYVSKEGSAPKLVLLSPHISSNYHCLFLNTLPTSEDFRDFVFPPLKESSSVQQIAMQSFVEALDLMNLPSGSESKQSDAISSASTNISQPSTSSNTSVLNKSTASSSSKLSAGAPSTSSANVSTDGLTHKEGLVPNSTFNPVLQYFYQCLSFRAYNPEAALPPLNRFISEYVRPDHLLFEKAGKQIESVKALFPLKETQMAAMSNMKNNRIFWRDIVHLQREQLEGRMIIESEGATVKISKNVLAEEDKQTIGTIDPVGDFKEMLQNTRVPDMTNEAIRQMRKIIIELLRTSIKDHLHKKAADCLKALRDGCIAEDEAHLYNDFIRKDLFGDVLKRKDVEAWVRVVKGEGGGPDLGLITDEECASAASVKKEEAVNFYKECDGELAKKGQAGDEDAEKNEMMAEIE